MAKRFKVYVLAPRKGRRERHWKIRIKGKDGTDVSRSVPGGEQAARREAAQLEVELNAGPGFDLKTFADVQRAKIQALKEAGKSPSTVKNHEESAKRLAPLLGFVAVGEITRAKVLLARDHLAATPTTRGKPPAPRTVNTYMRSAASAWTWCFERELVPFPWPKVSPLPAPNNKRPYTDAEVGLLLAHAKEASEGRWYPILALAAETGRRIGSVCALKGKDIDRAACTIRFGEKGEGGKTILLPVTPETMRLIPDHGPEAWVFRSKKRGGGYQAQPHRSISAFVRRATKEIGIKDRKRLDTHSLRRAFVATSDRAGIPTDVGRRVTGHSTRTMWDRYQSQAVGDDLREVVSRVSEIRKAAAPEVLAANQPPLAPPDTGVDVVVSHERRGTRTPNPFRVKSNQTSPQDEASAEPTRPVAGGASSDLWSVSVRCRDSPWGGPSERLATVSRWADEDPEAMAWLLSDPALQRLLMAALEDVAGVESKSAERKAE